MRRVVLAVLVSLLTLSVSGAFSLAVAEPCGTGEPAGGDSACPPTCVTCGCCAQAAEPVMLVLGSTPDLSLPDHATAFPVLLEIDPRDILHVPRPRLS